MRSTVAKSLRYPIAAALALAACGNPQDSKVNAGSIPTGSNGPRTGAVPPNGGAGDQTTGATPPPAGGVDLEALGGKSVLDAKYKIHVRAGGFDFCDGQVGILVNLPKPPARGEAPKSPFDIKCLSLNCALVGQIARVDSLSAILGALAKAPPAGATGEALPFVLDEKFLRFKTAGTISYQPPLILMPNFVGGDPAFLKHMIETQSISLQDSKDGASASGKQTITTVKFEQPDDTAPAPAPFKFLKTFHFRLQNDGFDGIDKIPALLFDTLEVKVNTEPMAVLYLKMSTKASDVMAIFGGMKKDPNAPPPQYDPACGPPPAAAPPGGGGIGDLLGGGGGAGGGIMSGPLAQLAIKFITKLITVEAEATLVEQKGLKEAFEKQKVFDDLINSQVDGKGSGKGTSAGSGS